MSTLIIHPKDDTTDFLKTIYDGLDVTLVTENISKSKLRNLIREHDKIVMMGHGCEKGLLGYQRLIIDSNFVMFLREKECVYIWCNANVFVNKYNLKGFHTGMIVSESIEANLYCLDYDIKPIEASNILFSNCIKESLSLSSKDMYNYVRETYVLPSNEIVNFNKENIFHNE